MTDDARIDAFEQLERVVADPLRFKLKLGIGDEAYRSIRYGRALQELWATGGAAAAGATTAGSSAVATTFFASSGWLASIGLGAAAATPVGWVIGAALASGGAYYGLTRAVRAYSRSRVDEIPRFINTPIDLLGANLLDMLGSLAVKLAQADGNYDDRERQCICAYFVEEWGFDARYVETAIDVIATGSDRQSLGEMTAFLTTFGRSSPDCDLASLRAQVAVLLQEIAEADGHLDEREEAAIREALDILGRETGARAAVSLAAGSARRWMLRKNGQSRSDRLS